MTLVFVALAVGAFLIGLSKGGLGGAIGALVTPLLALVMPVPIALGLALPMLLIGDCFALYAHWDGWDKRIVWAILPSTVVGVVIAGLLLDVLTPALLQRGLGLAALLYTAYKLWERVGKRVPIENVPRWLVHLMGALTGVASTIANAGAPVFTIYLLQLRLVPEVFVGTSVLYFALLNVIKIPAYLNSHVLGLNFLIVDAWAIPLIPFGVWSGVLLDRHIDMPTFETIILVLLAVTGVVLLIK